MWIVLTFAQYMYVMLSTDLINLGGIGLPPVAFNDILDVIGWFVGLPSMVCWVLSNSMMDDITKGGM